MSNLKKIMLACAIAAALCGIIYFATSGRSPVFKGEELKKEEVSYLQSLGLLSDSEQVILFSTFSEPSTLDDFKREGTFYTNKRVAAYLQAGDSASNFTYFTYYDNICTMDFFQGDILMTSPPSSILITRNDGSSNRVYLDVPGSKEFFEGLQYAWREHTAIP